MLLYLCIFCCEAFCSNLKVCFQLRARNKNNTVHYRHKYYASTGDIGFTICIVIFFNYLIVIKKLDDVEQFSNHTKNMALCTFQ